MSSFTKSLKYFLIVTLAIFLFIFSMRLLNIDFQTIINERILSKSEGGITEGSAGTRLLAFRIFPKMFMESPIFGVGAQITQSLENELQGKSSQLHVGYLSLLYYYGIVGGGLYFLFLISLTKRLYRNAKLHGNLGPIFGWLAFVLANFSLNYVVPYEAGLMLCLFFDKYYIFQHLEIKLVSKRNVV